MLKAADHCSAPASPWIRGSAEETNTMLDTAKARKALRARSETRRQKKPSAPLASWTLSEYHYQIQAVAEAGEFWGSTRAVEVVVPCL